MGGKSGEIQGGELMQWGGEGEGGVECSGEGGGGGGRGRWRRMQWGGGEGLLRIHTIVLYRDYMFGIKF